MATQTDDKSERQKVASRMLLVYAIVILGGILLFVLLGHFFTFHISSWHVSFGHYHPIQ